MDHDASAPIPAQIHEKVIKYIQCPHCGDAESLRIEHLLPPHEDRALEFGPWYCDKCGGSIKGSTSTDGTVIIRKTQDRKIRAVATLRLSPENAPFEIDVDHFIILKPGDDPDVECESLQYLFEEHVCPDAIMRHVVNVRNRHGEDDPHGLFDLVRVVNGEAAEKIINGE